MLKLGASTMCTHTTTSLLPWYSAESFDKPLPITYYALIIFYTMHTTLKYDTYSTTYMNSDLLTPRMTSTRTSWKLVPIGACEHVLLVGKSYYRDRCLCGDLERLVGSTTLLTTCKHVLFDSNILLVATLRNERGRELKISTSSPHVSRKDWNDTCSENHISLLIL